MSIQVLQRGPGLGASLGEALGGGLQKGLDQLADLKMQQMQAQQIGAAYESVGLPKELAFLPAQAQKSLFGALVERGGLGQLGGVSEEPSRLQELSFLPQQIEKQEHLPSLSANQLNNMRLAQNLEQALGGQKVPELERTEIPSQLMKQQQIQLQPRKKETIKDILARPTLKQSAEKQKEINKETLPFVTETKKAYKSAVDSDLRLDRMEQLINSGRLSYPLWASLVKTVGKGIFGFGLDLSSLLTPESQEFNKLQQDFLRSAKDIFGSRISNYEIEQYLKALPDLSQSTEGKKRVIEDLRSFNKAAKARYNAMIEIIKENRGMRPADLEEQIDERVNPLLDQLSSQFKKGYEGAYANQPSPSSAVRRILEPIGKATGQV